MVQVNIFVTASGPRKMVPQLTIIVYLKRVLIKACKKQIKDKNFYDIVYYNCSMLSFHSNLEWLPIRPALMTTYQFFGTRKSLNLRRCKDIALEGRLKFSLFCCQKNNDECKIHTSLSIHCHIFKCVIFTFM